MAISVIAPVSQAFEETRRALFQPFQLSKWFIVGFSAFLAAFLGTEGGGFNPSGMSNLNTPRKPAARIKVQPNPPAVQPIPGGQGEAPNPAEPAEDDDDFDAQLQSRVQQAAGWVKANLGLVLGISVIAALLMFAFGLIFTWLGCRGQFLLLDNIAWNRAEIAIPWREYRAEANSLFGFLAVFGLLGFVVCLGSFLGGAVLALDDVAALRFGAKAVQGLVVWVVPTGLWVIVASLVLFVLADFVVPIMFARRVRVLDGWRTFQASILPGNLGKIVLYFLFKMVLGIGANIARTLLICGTCCIGGLPYLGSVVTLPVTYVLRCYNLYFLEQFGAEFQVIGRGLVKPSTGLVTDPGDWPVT